MAAVDQQNTYITSRSKRKAGSSTDAVRQSARRPGRRPGDEVWNALTLFVWMGIAIVIVYMVMVYQNPQSFLNPFQPVAAEPTPVAQIYLPWWTETPTPAAAAGQEQDAGTPEPTSTPTPTVTPTTTPTEGPSPTATIHSAYPFILRSEPASLAGSTFFGSDHCKLTVAGQAYDLAGAPMTGITVMLTGYFKGETLYQVGLTGTALQYGQAGFEFVVADETGKSSGSIYVQLFDQALVPLSERIALDTYDDCSQNLILLHFRQVR